MRKVPLTNTQRFDQLNASLTELEGAVKELQDNGKDAAMVTVLSLLRALLITRPRNVPLLLDLANKNGFPLEFYVDFRWDEDLNEKIEAVLGGAKRILFPMDCFSLKKSTKTPAKISIEDWLRSPQAIVWETRLTGDHLIWDIASKEATHFDTEIPEWLVELKKTKVNEVASYHRTLISLSEIVIGLGDNLQGP